METDHIQRITEQQLEELRAKYKRIELVTHNGNELVFRKPKRTEVQRHRSLAHSEDKEERATADEALAQMTIVHVNGKEGDGGMQARQAFLDLLEEWPYLCNAREVAKALGRLSGTAQNTEGKGSGPNSTSSGGTPGPSPKV